MADETLGTGIEIEIDSRAAEPGKQRVIRSLEDIKRKTRELGDAGAEAGKRLSDGLGSGAASGAAHAAKSLDEVKAKARAAGDQVGRSGSSGFRAWSSAVDQVLGGKTQQAFLETERRALRVGQQIASGAGGFKAWSQQASQLQRVNGVLDGVSTAAKSAGQQVASGAGSFRTWSREAEKITQAAKRMDDLRAKTKSAHDQIVNSAARASAAFRAETMAIDRTLASAARLQPTFAQLEATAKRLEGQQPFRGYQTSARAAVPDLLSLRNLLVGIGAVELGKHIVNTEAQFRGFDQALKIVTGSSAGARKELEYVANVSDRLGLRTKDLTANYVGLMAASRGTALEGSRTREVFEGITKAGVAYGLSNDNIRGSLLAVQQMMSKGQVQAEELRGQLGERLPGAFQVAARAMGVTTGELSKMLEKGQVVSADFLPKFAAQLQKEIPDGAMSAYAGFNAFLNVLDQVTRVVANSGIFQGLADGAKGLGNALKSVAEDGSLATIASLIGRLMSMLGENADLLKAAALAYGVYFASIKVQILVAYISQLVALNMALGATTTASALAGVALKGIQGLFVALINPVTLTIGAIVAFGLALSEISASGNRTQAIVGGLTGTMKNAALSLREAQQRAGLAAISVASVGSEGHGAVGGINSFAGAVGSAAQQLWELARAKQAAQLSELIAQRNSAATNFNQLRAQSDSGIAERAEQARQTSGKGSGLRRVGNILSGVGQAFGVARDQASKALGFGPDEREIVAGMSAAQASVKAYEESIRLTRSSLEQFVTLQDKTAVAAAGATKPSLAMANALAKEAGATTEMQKAQAGLAVTRAQASSDLKAGLITQDQYVERVGAATRAVNLMRDAAKGSSKALAEQKKMLAEAERNTNSRQRIGDRYDEQPRFIDTLEKDRAALNDMVGQWIEIGDAVVKYTDAMRAADSATLDVAARRPFDDLMKQGMEELAIQQQILQGRHEEADALRVKFDYERQYGAMLPGQYRQVLAMAAAQRMISVELEKQQDKIRLYAQVVDDMQSSFERFLNDATKNPFQAGVNFLKDLFGNFKQMIIRSISNDLFGGIQQEIQDFVSGRSGVQDAVVELEKQTSKVADRVGDVGSSATDLAQAMIDAAKLIRDAASYTSNTLRSESTSSTGNDLGSIIRDATNAALDAVVRPQPLTEASGDDIVVTAKKLADTAVAQNKSAKAVNNTDVFARVIDRVAGRIGDKLQTVWNVMPAGMQNVLKGVGGTIKDGLGKLGIDLPDSIGGTISKGLKGAVEGQTASSLVGMLGVKQSSTGSAIGGMLGALSGIPGGSLIGGVLGGTIGGLFQSKKKDFGTASFASDQYGNLTVGGTTSRGKDGAKAASGAVTAINGGLSQVAQQLGGMVTGTPDLMVGQYDGKWRVRDSTSGWNGQGGLNFSGNSAKGLTDFGDDQQGAIAYAIQLAVKQGVISGISEASKRVLSSASNTDQAIQAAATYEDLLRQAAKLRDPIKGAFDEVKRGMDNTIAQLKAVGYSQEEINAVQIVWQEQQKQALEEMTSGYRQFMDDITKGPDSGLTIYDQFLAAQKDFATAKSGLATGETTQDEFTSAGQRLFDLARQTYGTATPEFDALKDTLVQATQSAIDAATNAANESGMTAAVQAAAAKAEEQRTEANTYLADIAETLKAAGTAPSSGYTPIGGGGSNLDRTRQAAY